MQSRFRFTGPYLFIGFALGLAYWFFDAAVMAFIFNDGSWTKMALYPDADDLYMRSFAWVMFTVSGGAINLLVSKQKSIISQQADLTDILENSLNEIYIFDATTLKFLFVNRGARENLGYTQEECLNLTLTDISSDGNAERLGQLLKPLRDDNSQKSTFPGFQKRADGSLYPIEIHVQNTSYNNQPAFVAIIFDTTQRNAIEQEKQQLELQIQHSQKLESLGLLAGGIAHDFNNLLVGMLGNADLALEQTPPAAQSHKYLSNIIDAAQQAAGLCNQLLAYSGKGRFVVRPVNLSMLVDEMQQLLQVTISKNITFRHRVNPDLPAVEADVTQIQQVIMNLITNASEAIGDQSGIITITTGVIDCDRTYLQKAFAEEELAAGHYVFLEITDNGEGMDEPTRSQIFDPFFTSKFTGRGLGLSAVLGIVRGHKGAIQVYSEPGKGTSFKLLFPETTQPVEELGKKQSTHSKWMGSGKALVVDDDHMVQEVAQQFLLASGFEVLLASDGLEGVELFQQHAEELSVVLLDMTMPRMDGAEAFREMRQINDTIPVILSSGYNEQEATNQFVGRGLAGFIQKPYQMAEFLAAVQQAVTK
ncbi:MAG: hypothetical protein DRQ60_01340 [Gammaproteobacteria bacterium]|nr:MAG: hypothetical protein DRQ52_00160 [Gammaproteobacteria bacterium]RLA17694.1 MAG: hypothetical protein DRQ60_01340 [Gammaproteobacteria bacterium]